MGQPENMSSAPQAQTIHMCERESRLEIAAPSAAKRQIASRPTARQEWAHRGACQRLVTSARHSHL